MPGQTYLQPLKCKAIRRTMLGMKEIWIKVSGYLKFNVKSYVKQGSDSI